MMVNIYWNIYYVDKIINNNDNDVITRYNNKCKIVFYLLIKMYYYYIDMDYNIIDLGKVSIGYCFVNFLRDS